MPGFLAHRSVSTDDVATACNAQIAWIELRSAIARVALHAIADGKNSLC
jgi:hypothetical protein